VTRAGGGGGTRVAQSTGTSSGGTGGGTAGVWNDDANAISDNGTANTGGGSGGAVSGDAGTTGASGNGGSGVVILKYPDAYTITIGAGLTGSTASPSGGFKVSTITAGTGNVSWA
jgi:hypothetical protein